MSKTLPLALVPTEDPQLPAMLERPETPRQPIAKLTWVNMDEDEKGRGGPRWKVEGSPMAVDLFRRLFNYTGGGNRAITFPAVEANFGDLLMALHRYPVLIGKSAQGEFERQYDQFIERFLAQAGLGPAPKLGGGRFKGQLREFQEEGVRFLLGSRKALLADDMGLGKTVQAFAFLDRLDKWPAVVVVQPHVQYHWLRKAPEFLDIEPASSKPTPGKLTYVHLTGQKPGSAIAKADLYIVHYLVLHAWSRWLIGRGVRTVVLDEVQEARHPGTKKHDALRLLCGPAASVIGLSGTPIYNRGPEIFNVMNVISKGALGTKADFERTWCTYDSNGMVLEDPATFGQYLLDRKLMIRRRKDEVAKEIPEKHRAVELIESNESKFAELIREAVKLARESAFMSKPLEKARMEAEAIARARKATGIAKTPAVIAFLLSLLEAEQPTIVFAHHHAVHDAICAALERFNPVRITGEETTGQKALAQRRFQSGESNLCVIALRAATGIDGLQERARVVVFAELDWSPAVHAQAEDRAHRMGQKHGVLVYYLVAEVGSDPFVMLTLNVKENQFLGLMQDQAETEEDRTKALKAAQNHQAELLDTLRSMKL